MLAACGGNRNVNPQSTGQPDRFLMDRATESMGKRNWIEAREYYRQIVDNYPQSPLRPDAKLGIGETYLGEGSTESLVVGANEFREFLTFYPTNPKADQAQYKLAMTLREADEGAGARPDRHQRGSRRSFRPSSIAFPTVP